MKYSDKFTYCIPFSKLSNIEKNCFGECIPGGERGRYVIPAYLRRFRTFPTETAGLPSRLSGAVRERCDSLLFLCIHSGNIKGKTPYKLPCSGSSTLFVRRWPTRPPPDRESRDKQLPNGPKHSGLIHEINV